jgi:hypothetical protein
MASIGSQFTMPARNGDYTRAEAAEILHVALLTQAEAHGIPAEYEGHAGHELRISVNPLARDLFPEWPSRTSGSLVTALKLTGNAHCLENARGGGNGAGKSLWWVSAELRNKDSLQAAAAHGRMPGSLPRVRQKIEHHAALLDIPDEPEAAPPQSSASDMLRGFLAELDELRAENKELRERLEAISAIAIHTSIPRNGDS